MLVFVYGTLKKGHSLHGWLRDTPFISEGFTSKVSLYLPNKLFPYPFCLEEQDSNGVYGEVYKVDDKELAMLDMVEGYPSMYDRKEFSVTLLGGEKCECYIYVLNMTVNTDDFNSAIKFEEER